MDIHEAGEIVRQLSYKPGWKIYIWEPTEGDLYLQVTFSSPCTVTGEKEEQFGRKWRISKYMTKSEVVLTAFKAVLAAEEHECRERFRYRGEAILGPHFDVDSLVELCRNESYDRRALNKTTRRTMQ